MRDKLDTIVSGMILGFLAIFLMYLILENWLYIILHNNGKGYLLFPPRMQLFILVIMVAFMRIFMINLRMYNFGKGWLASVFVAALAYFYLVKYQLIK